MSAPISLPASSPSPSTRTTMRWRRRSRRCPTGGPTTTAPESRAVMSPCRCRPAAPRARSSGTAWRCMFEPISARFASSCSRNGMSEAATETELLGRHVDELDVSRGARMKSPALRAFTRSCVSRRSASTRSVRLGDDVLVLFPRRQVEGVRFATRPASCAALGLGVLLGARRLDDVADLELRAAAVLDQHVVDHPAVLDLAVRASR